MYSCFDLPFFLSQAGLDPKPEIMVPVVSTAKELRLIVPRIEAAVAEELSKAGAEVSKASDFFSNKSLSLLRNNYLGCGAFSPRSPMEDSDQ